MSEDHQTPDADLVATQERDERQSLLVRTAKVVCQSGEYLCLIRDFTELGASLRFLHEAPPEPRIILALANGLTIPIERIWAGKRQAGYRFGASVPSSDCLYEATPYSPRPIRLSVPASARILNGRASHSAQMMDVSTHGAKIVCKGLIPAGHLIGFQAEGMRPHLGQVVWSDESRAPFLYGIEFQHVIELQELASFAFNTHPFDTQSLGDFTNPLKRASAA